MRASSKGERSGKGQQINQASQQGSEAQNSEFNYPFLEGPITRSWYGNSHNTALAAVAAIEDADTDDGVNEYHVAELSAAPMFRLLVEEFQNELAKPGDRGLTIAIFASRLFLAGDLWQKTVVPPERNTILVSREFLEKSGGTEFLKSRPG